MKILILLFFISGCCSLSSHQTERLRMKCSTLCNQEQKEIKCHKDCLKCSCGMTVCVKDL